MSVKEAGSARSSAAPVGWDGPPLRQASPAQSHCSPTPHLPGTRSRDRYGRERVLRLLAAFATQGATFGGRIVQTTVNAQPGTLNLDRDGKLINVFSFEILDGQIQTIRSIINPEKLQHLGYPLSSIGRKRQAPT